MTFADLAVPADLITGCARRSTPIPVGTDLLDERERLSVSSRPQ